MASQAEIEYHYDINTDFFAAFLDTKYRVYSCGVWKRAATLEEAQQDKLDRICRFAGVTRRHRVLDVGCGWGGLMRRAVERFSAASAHGLTLSCDQFRYLREQSFPRTTVELRGWSETQFPAGAFDAIASIGAFEHFASRQDRAAGRQRAVYRRFFEWCSDVSAPDAAVGLQTIVTARQPAQLSEVRDTRFLLQEVFPGSALPTISDIQAAVQDLYEISDARRIGGDYARTLAEWRQRLEREQRWLRERFGDRLVEHYRSYFMAAERSFQSGVVDLVQLSLRKVRPARQVLAA